MPPNLNRKRFYLLLVGHCAALGTSLAVVGVLTKHLLSLPVAWQPSSVFIGALGASIAPFLSGRLLREFQCGRHPWLRSGPLPPQA